MWQFFSRDSSRDFQYEYSDDSEFPEFNGFSLRAGTHKVTKDSVTVFCFNKKCSSPDQYEHAKASMKRLKTLRHPNILTYLDSLETDSNLLVVTESVKPLIYYLSSIDEGKGKQLYLSWGLMNIFKGVSFLNQGAKLKHNDVGIGSVFVNTAGEWKLGNFGKTQEFTGNDEAPWSADSYGLGVLIWEVYNSKQHVSHSQLSNASSIPAGIKRTYQELLLPQESMRPSPHAVLEKGRKPGGFFQNDLVDALVFLEEIHIKNKEEINLFFRNLQPLLNAVPKCTAEHKILPQLIKAFEYGCEGNCVLPPLFEITNHVSENHFQNVVVPFLIKAFGSTDRATRSLLLANLEQYIEKVPASVINESLFPQIVNGFMDTNPRIREQTVKAMIHIAPKLNEKNLNTDLMGHFARIFEKDNQGGIRTNTIVCLTKIGYCLDPQKRRLILMSAYLRALKDPFPPVRNAGTLGLAVSQQYFALEDVSKRILPALCALTLDPETSVRESVFKTIKGFLSNLEKVSENPELQAEMEAEALSSKKPTSSWAEWATTAITSKFSLKMDRKAPEQPDQIEKPKDEKEKVNKSITSSELNVKSVAMERPKTTASIHSDEPIDEVSSTALSDKMKYVADETDNEFNWDGDSWEALEIPEPAYVKLDRPPMKRKHRNAAGTPQARSANSSNKRKDISPQIKTPKASTDDIQSKIPTEPLVPIKVVPDRPNKPKADEERKKSRSGPMKLGTRLNQPKFLD